MNRPATPRAVVALLVALPLLVACWSVPEVERRQVRSWLVCTDCTDGEYDRVVAMGSKATRYLRASLEDGPTTVDDSIVHRQAEEGVLRARRYRSDRSIPAVVGSGDSSSVVARQVAEFRLRYRLRAAQALGAIDPRADSTAVARLCANPPPEFSVVPEFRAQFKHFGNCP